MKKIKLPYWLLAFVFMLSASLNTYAQSTKIDTKVTDEYTLKMQDLPYQSTHKPLPLNADADKAVYFTEDFETWPPANWTFINVGAGFVSSSTAYSGAQSAKHNDDNMVCADWMITPAITLAAGLDASLTFWQMNNYGALYYVLHDVAISVNADMTDSTILYTGVALEDAWEQIAIDVTAYAGQTVYIGFYYEGDYSDEWWIDEIIVQGPSDENDITAFEVINQVGDVVIDADAHTVMAEVMYDSTLLLTPYIEISAYATIAPDTEQDFASPVTYTVTSQSGIDQDWVVTVTHIPPLEGFEILDIFNIDNLVGDIRWDIYGHRIEAEVMYDSSLLLSPEFEISEYAIIDPLSGSEQDFSGNLGVTYTVTAQSGAKGALPWRVIIENTAPVTDAAITYISHETLYDWYIDTTAVNLIMETGTDLTSLKPEFTVSWGATITDTTQGYNFTSGPIVYDVTAQDGETIINYSVYAELQDSIAPVLTFASASIVNFGDSVLVKSSEDGWIYAVTADSVEVASLPVEANVDTYMHPYDAEPGTYFVVGEDLAGNMTEMSANSVVIDTAIVEVGSIAELWEFMDYENVIFTLTGEAIVTYTQSYRHKKYVQDATGGMEIDDDDEVIPDTAASKADPYYIWGDGITGLTGYLNVYYGQLQFVPTEIPTLSSTGNEIVPIVMTLEEFMYDNEEYQNMIVEVLNVTFADADGVEVFETGYSGISYDIYHGETWGTFRTNFFEPDYIGEVIPEGAQNIVGVKHTRSYAPALVARALSDFEAVDAPLFFINTDMIDFGSVLYGESANGSVHIMNTGGGEIVATAYLVGGDNAFYFIDAPFVNQVLEDEYLGIMFAPATVGDFGATFIIEYGDGMMAEVALTGSAELSPVFGIPYYQGFEDILTVNPPDGWTFDTYGAGWGGYYTNHTGSFGYGHADNTGTQDDWFITPAFDLTGAESPFFNFWQYDAYASWYTYHEVAISVDKENWTTLYSGVAPNYAWEQIKLSLVDYIDEVVYIGFHYEGNYSDVWIIDDIELVEQPTTPVYAANAEALNFGAVDANASEVFGFTINNAGISFLTINSAVISGTNVTEFNLVDATDYPWEISGDDYNLYLNKNSVGFTVEFNPTSIGAKEATLTITYTDPREGVMTDVVPLSGIGISCADAVVAVVGENIAPYASIWYEYTPAVDELVTVSSCIAGQFIDTDVEVYDACGGNLVAANDDEFCEESGFPWSSTVTFAAAAGNTYKILWLDTYESIEFVFMLEAEPLPTAPVLLDVQAFPLNEQDAKAVLTFEPMMMLPEAKSNSGALSLMAMDKYTEIFSFVSSSKDYQLAGNKDFVPDGDPETEPNGSQEEAQYVAVGTVDEPGAITGHFGVDGDYDWFAILKSEIGFYFDLTLEVEGGACQMLLVYQNDGWWGWSKTAYADEMASFSFEQLYTNEDIPDTMYVWVRRASAEMDPVEEPGLGYNFKVWSADPPTFSVYKDNLMIESGPMAFKYVDETCQIDVEACYTVTQELLDGSESDHSNEICVVPDVGPGDVCIYSIPVEAGFNECPRSPYWFKYVPSITAKIIVTSNIEENGDPGDDWNDTWLFIYDECGAPYLYENDDVDPGVIRTSYLEFDAEGGKPYYINWRRWAPEGENNEYDSEPFFFTIEEVPLSEGDVVGTAIPLELPAVNESGNTAGYGDDYDVLDCDDNYITGDDICYIIEIEKAGTISGDITGNYAGLFVIKGSPGNDVCIADATGSTGGSFTDEHIDAGEYFVIVSSYAEPQSIEYVFNLAHTPYASEDVTFNVDMSAQIHLENFDPDVDSVDMVANISYWESIALTDAGDGIYTITLTDLTVGDEIRYKYRINCDWQTAEFDTTIYEHRVYIPVTGDNIVDDLYDDMPIPTVAITFTANMNRVVALELFDPANSLLDIAGDFNSWDGLGYELVENENLDNFFSITIGDLIVGNTYEFKFRMNGGWDGTEETDNRVYVVPDEDSEFIDWYDRIPLNTTDLNSLSMFDVYPNPNNGLFHVALNSDNAEDYTIELVNLQGQIVYSKVMRNVTNTVNTIDVAELAKGVYYLKVNERVKKVVIK